MVHALPNSATEALSRRCWTRVFKVVAILRTTQNVLYTIQNEALYIYVVRFVNKHPDNTRIPGLLPRDAAQCAVLLRQVGCPSVVIVQCLRSDSSCFGHYNRSCFLTYFSLVTCESVPSVKLWRRHWLHLIIKHCFSLYSDYVICSDLTCFVVDLQLFAVFRKTGKAISILLRVRNYSDNTRIPGYGYHCYRRCTSAWNTTV